MEAVNSGICSQRRFRYMLCVYTCLAGLDIPLCIHWGFCCAMCVPNKMKQTQAHTHTFTTRILSEEQYNPSGL